MALQLSSLHCHCGDGSMATISKKNLKFIKKIKTDDTAIAIIVLRKWGSKHHNNGSHITIAKLLKLKEKLTMAEQLPSPNFEKFLKKKLMMGTAAIAMLLDWAIWQW